MTSIICGGVVVDFADQPESNLDRLMRRLRSTLRNFLDTLKQPGNPL
ncbi:protease FtsH-inhibitory lysogeny factor CIII [Enterobacterales bacterium CwR94]|nr:protease FtsH-inhibitory lysogeny factor CIII [Enterobacterales bacterium CwR94]